MAWISVDQKLIGGKLRTLYKEIGCSRNEALGILITLWLWGIDNTDMDGLIPSADKSDIAEVIRPGISEDLDPEEVAGKLIECGWIDQQDGNLYLHDWGDWRAYYNSYVNRKKNHADYMRERRQKERDTSECDNHSEITVNDTVNITEKTESNPDKPPEEKAEKYGKDFEEFWEAYPRKADKGACFKKYKARVKDGYSPEELLAAARNYRSQCERDHTEQKYIKHGKTFLGESLSFTEYIPAQRSPEAPQQGIPDGVNPFRI